MMLSLDTIIKITEAEIFYQSTQLNSQKLELEDLSEKCSSQSIFLARAKKEQKLRRQILVKNTHDINYLTELIGRGTNNFIIEKKYLLDNEYKNAFQSFLKENEINITAILLVESSEETLYRMASYIRKKINPIVIAVTGSVGKTTTTEILNSILLNKYKTHKSNVTNTFYAISKSILSMPLDTEVLIVEVSTRRQGLMQKNSKILEPDIAIITTVQLEHVQGMGSLENIAIEKLNITKFMKSSSALFLPNLDILKKNLPDNFNKNIHIVNNKNFEIIYLSNSKMVFKYNHNQYIINSVGEHNIQNAILAIEVAVYLNLDLNKILFGLQLYSAIGNRWNVTNIDKNIVIINDSPNNPSHATIKSSIITLSQVYKNYKKIIILSDILEMGNSKEEIYNDLGYLISKLDIFELVLYGSEIKDLKNFIHNDTISIKIFNKKIDAPIKFFYNGELTNYIGKIVEPNTVVLIKASRIMGFDKISHNIERYCKDKLKLNSLN